MLYHLSYGHWVTASLHNSQYHSVCAVKIPLGIDRMYSTCTVLYCNTCMHVHVCTMCMYNVHGIVHEHTAVVYACYCLHERHNSLGHERPLGLDVRQSPNTRHRMRFSQYQASSAALGWPGVWVFHIMHEQNRWLALGLHSHTAWQPMVVLASFSLGFVTATTHMYH